MPKNLSTPTKEIMRDAYTERLLAVCYELVKRKALARKQDYSQALGFRYHTQFNAIENRKANFPSKNAQHAEAQLLAHWGVNPKYLQGNDAQMFIWEPPALKMAIGEDAALRNFRNKREKEQLLAENSALKARVQELEGMLLNAAEPKITYNPDKNPDKKRKK